MPLFLFHGNHSYARKKAREFVVDKYAGPGVNISLFNVAADFKENAKANIKQKISSDSLFSQKETIIVVFEEKNRDFAGFILPYLPKISPDATLILEAQSTLPKASRLLKAVERFGGKIQLHKLPLAKDKNILKSEVQAFLKKEKINMDWYLVQKLIDSSKGNWWQVFSLLEQAVLLLHAGGDVKRNQENLLQFFDIEEEKNIFKLFDVIGDGDKMQAFSFFYENGIKGNLKTGGEVEIVLGFTSLMARQIKQMIAVKSNPTLKEAQENWQIPPFVFAKLKRQASYFSLEFLSVAYEKLAELQEKAKKGTLQSPFAG